MAISMVTGSLQTVNATSLVPLTPAAASIVWKKDEPGEAIIDNASATLTQPNTIRYAYTQIADVYAKTGVSPLATQRREGFSLLTEVNETWMVYDDASTLYTPYYLPVRAHMVLRLPIDAQVTAAATTALINRLIGALTREAHATIVGAIGPYMHGVVRNNT